MGLLGRIAGMFTRQGRNEEILQRGFALAKDKQPEKAIALYNGLLAASNTSNAVRASALFNRALAWSSLKDDDRALADLEQLLGLPNVPDNVQTAARSQIARVKRRGEKLPS